MRISLLVLGLIAVVVVAIGLIGYMIVTNSIIKSQEKEIANLRRELNQVKRVTSISSVKKGDTIKFGEF